MGDNETVVGGTIPQRIRSCMATLDTFLCQTNAICSSFVLADKVVKKSSGGKADLVQSVARILGVKDVSSVNPDMTLANLGLDSLMGVEVKQALERDHEIVLQMRDIRALTMNKLKEIAEGATADDTENETKDLSLVRYDMKNLMPPEVMKRVNEGEYINKPLFVVHPIEGKNHKSFKKIEYFLDKINHLHCTTKETFLHNFLEI